MRADPKGVLTGTHFLDGDHACCEGALAAGARFAAGYPITPSTEVVERFAARIPTVGGVFIQMEDELAASIAIQGAALPQARPGRQLCLQPLLQRLFDIPQQRPHQNCFSDSAQRRTNQEFAPGHNQYA